MRKRNKQTFIITTTILALLFTVSFQGMLRAEEGEIPSPEPLKLKTKDGVRLHATYYGSDVGKEAVPVIIIHDNEGTQNEFAKLAEWMQQGGTYSDGKNKTVKLPSLAVITVDLRGHGGSTRLTLPSGESKELDASKLRKQDYLNMIRHDMEAVRKHLIAENNDGKLNLNKLTIIGSGMGATIALNWSAQDWSMPRLATGKQGQDVKALVLVSPRSTFKGIAVRDALKQPGLRRNVSMLILYGAKSGHVAKDAKRIHKMILPYQPEPQESEWEEKQSLFIQGTPVNVQGTKLLNAPNTGLDNLIAQFIDLRVVKKDYDWIRRKRN